MRSTFLLLLLLAACVQAEPEVRCVTHSIEATGGGLVECGPVAD